MELPTDLTVPLAALTQSLDDDGTDLQAILAVLHDDLIDAVPSYLGLRITFHPQGYAITLSTVGAFTNGTAQATLRLPLAQVTGDPGGEIVFYAALPGAFTELAADARYSYDLDGQVQVDEHLLHGLHQPHHRSRQQAALDPGIQGPPELAEINQAIGVLIEGGVPAVEAAAALHARAADQGIDILAAARRILQELTTDGTHADRGGGG